MRKRKIKRQPVNDVIDTTIADGLQVRGDISSEGDIWINGYIEGNVSTTARVTLGENGTVDGNITGSSVRVSGTVNGNIVAEEALSYEDTARIYGQSHTPNLQVASGAIIVGKVVMPSDDLDDGSHTDDTE